ncbi:MAG: hypothetical protein GY760_19510 [Deltaproteobacteria bacterium]|nr:hypothetical protein [Deltaproteobacteria bacterium]
MRRCKISPICSKQRQNIFSRFVGEPLACSLSKKSIKLTKVGQTIENQWKDIPNQNENIDIDEFIIMPNHIHGILIIKNQAEASTAPTISQIIRSFKSKSIFRVSKIYKEQAAPLPT